MTVAVFLISIAAGLAVGLVLWAETLLARATGLVAVTVVLDVAVAFLAVAAYAALLYFVSNGKFYLLSAVSYALCALLPVLFLPQPRKKQASAGNGNKKAAETVAKSGEQVV